MRGAAEVRRPGTRRESRRNRLTTAVLLLSSVLWGCSDSDDPVGVWILDVDAANPPAEMNVGGKLVIGSDSRFTMEVKIADRVKRSSGTWARSGREIVFSPTDAEGGVPDPPGPMVAIWDGARIRVGDPPLLVFVRR